MLISLVYLARLVAPSRRDPAGVVGFTLFGLIGATLLTVRLIG